MWTSCWRTRTKSGRGYSRRVPKPAILSGTKRGVSLVSKVVANAWHWISYPSHLILYSFAFVVQTSRIRAPYTDTIGGISGLETQGLGTLPRDEFGDHSVEAREKDIGEVVFTIKLRVEA